MGLAQAQLLVHFQVQLDEEAAVELMRGKFVNRQALPLRRRADGVEQVLARRALAAPCAPSRRRARSRRRAARPRR